MNTAVQPTHNSALAPSGTHHPVGAHDAHSSGLAHNGRSDAYDGRHSGGALASHLGGRSHANATIFLRPIADPGALGWSGFAIGTFIVSSWLTRWWGSELTSPLVFFGFVSVFGGLAQFMAGMFSFHARDNLYTVFFTLWGSFYIAFGILSLLYAYGIGAPSIFGPQGTYGNNDDRVRHLVGLAPHHHRAVCDRLDSPRRRPGRHALDHRARHGLAHGWLLSWPAQRHQGRRLHHARRFSVRLRLFIIEDNIAPANKRGGNVRTAAIPLGGKADSTSNGVDDGAGEAGVKRGGHAIRHAEHAGFNDDKAVSRPVA